MITALAFRVMEEAAAQVHWESRFVFRSVLVLTGAVAGRGAPLFTALVEVTAVYQ